MDPREREWAGVAGFYFDAKAALTRHLLRRALRGRPRNLRLLSVGAGTGEEIREAAAWGQVCAIDVNPDALQGDATAACAERRLSDACAIDYPDASFDAVLCLDVLEHIDDDAKAAAEARRVLRPGGALVFSVPAFEALFSAHDRALGHCRRYSPGGIRRLLADFADVSVRFWNSTLFPAAAVARLARRGGGRARLDWDGIPRPLTPLLGAILRAEVVALRLGARPPFGLTLAGTARR